MPAFLLRLGVGFSRFIAGLLGKQGAQALLGNLSIIGTGTIGGWLSDAWGTLTGSDTTDAEETAVLTMRIVGGLVLAVLLILGWKAAKRAFR